MTYNVSIQAYGSSTTLTVDNWDVPVLGTPSNINASGTGSGNVAVEFDYATLPSDDLTHFLIYIGTSGSPDWNAATTYFPGAIQPSYSTSVVTLDTGTLYCAVRAVGGALTADSVTVSFFYDPNATVAVPTNVVVIFDGSADTSWDYNAIGGDVLLGFLVYVGQSSTPNWSEATNVGLAGGTSTDTAFSYDVPTNLKGRAYVAVRAYGSGGITATSEVILAAASPYDVELATAATNGLDVAYIAAIYFGGSIGTQYYSSREIVIGESSHVPKIIGIPELQKRIDPSVLRAEPLSDSVTLTLVNTPEGTDGTTDANRIQTLLKAAGAVGLRVDIGLASVNQGIFVNSYTDGVYRIDQVTFSNNEVSITCVDRMLQPGEKIIGATVTTADWPVAPAESLNVVRGPVFGKVDGLPLVPVEVGMSAVLASEIDEQDTLIYLSVDDMSLWPTSGWVEIGDEIIQYSTLDTTAKRLGSVVSPCVRGLGFPATTPAAHVSGAVAHEFYSGRIAVLDGALDAVATSINLVAPEYLPSAGVVRIGDEYIAYTGKTGNTLTGCVRGWAAPTIAKVHDIGSPVRTFPIGPDGQPRYRYVIGEGQVSAISSLRVQDEGMSLLPYSGGTPTLSQVTGVGTGKVWSVVDLPARPRFEKFESSGSEVPPEWVMETDGAVDGEGVATPESFLRWRVGAGMSSDHLLTWPRALDLEASTRAVILEAETNKNVFSVEFDAGWDIGANAPRAKYGRFRDARLRIRVQYDRQTTIQPEFQVWSNGFMYKSGYFQPPTLGGTTGDGTVSGSQTLPASRWNTQAQTRDVRFSPRTTDLYSDNFVGYWIDPWKITGLVSSGRADHTAAVSGDTRTFVSGGWRHSTGEPVLKTEESPGLDLGDLELFSNDVFPETTSTDIVTGLVLTLHNPSGLSSIWTGWTGVVRLYPNNDHTGTPISKAFGMSNSASSSIVNIDLTGEGYPVTWAHIQSIKISIDQWHQIGFDNKGVTVGDVALAVEYVPDVEGQRVGTIVDGSYFSATATTTPSTIYDQVVSLGATAKEAGRTAGVDPWMFFTDIAGGEGMRVVVSLPTTGGLRFAVADVFLELEYDALTVIYDGTVLADADGRTGEPMGGGASVLLENPVDILKLLIDSTEFCSFGHLAGVKDYDSWTAAKSLTEAVGWKMARAIVEPVPLRDLVASICAESRLAILSDSLYFYLRVRLDEPSVDDSVRTVGDGTDPEYALVRDDVPIVNQVTDIYNSIGFKYRRSYLTGDFQAVLEEVDTGSVTLYGKRATTMDLQWHQSARGYSGGIAGQDEALELFTAHIIARSARLWDYATIELPVSAAEDLQRLDVITLNYPRSGYNDTPGWVIQKQRRTNPLRWNVVLQL